MTMTPAGSVPTGRFLAKTLLTLLLLGTLSQGIRAQFYNGSQLTFGKNRVQYNNFFWTFYRFDRYDTYFYLNGKELATYCARYADQHIKEIESELQSSLEEKIQFIIFNNLSDLKQSNIGLVGEWDSYNTGGVTRIIGGKVMIYFDGNYDHFERQIRAGIATVILNEMIYGTGIGAQIKNNALFTMPEWYLSGLVSYVSEKWTPEVDNLVRDAILKGKFEKFSRLSGKEATYAGQSMWNYIAIKYGESNIPNIVYMARLSRNVEKGFLYVLGVSFKDLISEWLAFYKDIYSSEELTRGVPDGTIVNKRPKPDRIYRQVKLSPDGRHLAYVTHELGIYKVFLYDQEKDRKKKIYRGGYRLQEKEDYTYPVLAWNPTGEVLAILTEKKGEDYLYFYNVADRSIEKQILFDFDKVLDLSYSEDGLLLVMSAVRKGQSDIYVYNIASKSFEQITRDPYNDLNPRFINHSTQILFSSNRDNDTIRFDPRVDISKISFDNDLFLYDYANHKNVLKRVTRTPGANEIMPMPYRGNYFTYLSNESGIYNRYIGRFDSAIAYVDTAVHYRYFTHSFPVTNYSRNILEQETSPLTGKYAEIVYKDNHFTIYTYDMPRPSEIKTESLQNTFFERLWQRGAQGTLAPGRKDTLTRTQEINIPEKKHFSAVKEQELPAKTVPAQGEPALQAALSDTIPKSSTDTLMRKKYYGTLNARKDTLDKFATAKQLNYNVEYAIDQMVTQLDFNYLNSSYQPFSNSSFPNFFNPGLNALFMVGVTDLMEDHRLTGGVRLNFNLINNEYLFSYSNLTRRLDHQIVFHRVSIEEATYYSIIRHRIHELYYVLTYPFTPVLSIRGTAELRYDRAVYLATDQFNLKTPDVDQYWGVLKGELTYDNTRSIGLNLYNGTRYKVFGEYYHLINSKATNMFTLGLDFRHYVRLHRSMILALRLAGGTSFGQEKVVYYLGGVDNWLVPGFYTNVPVATDQNYAFQALATNMRGFAQNIRNGNSFFVFNSEVRLPVFRYFLNHPVRSDLLNNFQVVAFGDVGTAWTGPTPYSEQNELFTTYIDQKPLFIKVELLKEPIVEGFGCGLRTRIFGYFVRGDVAWGVEDGHVRKAIFYVSLSLDF
ncbi:MAG TPA: hypothetical protein VMC08_03080 [Bacteroidales bacterium]|nr:hypothetical protein [Bacteroidales bacterium]